MTIRLFVNVTINSAEAGLFDRLVCDGALEAAAV